jgi:hypothetical protein
MITRTLKLTCVTLTRGKLNMGLFGKSNEEKADDSSYEWCRLNILSTIIPWCLNQCQAETDIMKSVDFAMKLSIYKICSTSDKGRVQDYAIDMVMRVGLKLVNGLKDTYGESMETLDFVTELTNLHRDTMKNVLAAGVIDNDAVQNLVEITNEEIKEARLIFMKELHAAEINSQTSALKVVVSCPSCKQKCRVKSGKTIQITCPNCSNVWVEKF